MIFKQQNMSLLYFDYHIIKTPLKLYIVAMKLTRLFLVIVVFNSSNPSAPKNYISSDKI